MSQREQPLLDRFTGVDELLAEIDASLKTLIESEGVADVGAPDRVVPQPYEYATTPDEYYPVAFPQGITTLDFTTGEISHTDPDGKYPDAGTFETGLRTYEDMTRDITGANLQGLRSIAIEPDQPVAVKLNENGWLNVAGGVKQVIRSLGFRRVHIRSPHSYRLRIDVSTRVGAFDSVNVTTGSPRIGYHDRVGDGWEFVEYWPPDMDNTLEDVSVDHNDYAERVLPFNGFDKAGVIVANDSSAANAIDARILARDDYEGGSTASPTWYQIGDSIFDATGGYLAQGDHYHWMVEVPHHQLAVQVTNETNGDDYIARSYVQLGGR